MTVIYEERLLLFPSYLDRLLTIPNYVHFFRGKNMKILAFVCARSAEQSGGHNQWAWLVALAQPAAWGGRRESLVVVKLT
jgi:hypothetical protein